MLEICRLTIVESLRRRLTHALFLATLTLAFVTGWAFWEISRLSSLQGEARLQLVFLQLFFIGLFTVMLALTAVFTAASAMAGDLESSVAAAILARPISRRQYLLGKWLGLAVIVGGFAVLTGSGELLVGLLAGYSPPQPAAALALICGQALLMMTLSLALATRLSTITSAIIATLAFFLAWMLGSAGTLGLALQRPALTLTGEIAQLLLPTNGLWQSAEYFLEPRQLIQLAHSVGMFVPFVALAPNPPAFYGWATLWMAAVLALAVRSINRRPM